MKITYDPAKRQKTLEERGLDFEDAPLVFAGKHFTREDDRKDYGEVRFITAGLLQERMYASTTLGIQLMGLFDVLRG